MEPMSGETEPTFWSMERLFAPVTSQASFTRPPPVDRLDGVAVKLLITGGVMGTVTPAVAVLLPFAFVAVNLNVVVVVTVTVMLPMVTGDTGPTPWSMERLVAPVTFHASVTGPPPTSVVDGVAVKLLMTGGGPPTTTTHCWLVLSPVPVEPVAVSVKVVDVVTLAEVLPDVGGFTPPTPLSMETLTAPVTFQDSVTWPPPNGS